MIIGNSIMAGGKKPAGTLDITENGTYDVTAKASAIVNVNSVPVLLWTNESPTSQFLPQTISFDGVYSGYIIETRASTNSSTTLYFYLPLNTEKDLCNGENHRIATGAEAAITFGGGKATGGTSTTLNTRLIPLSIWGVKWTL